MFVDIAVLIFSLVLILFAAAVFTNGIEVLGSKLNLHQGAVGSILAAVGTAMPETIIPIIAILFSSGAQAHEVGIGAIAGAPFMLGTLAFFVTGVAVVVYALLGRRQIKMAIDPKIVTRDLTFFIALYGIAVATTFVHEIVPLKVAVGIGLVLSYGWYLKRTLQSDSDKNEVLEPLMMSRYFKVAHRLRWAAFQVLVSLGIMILGAHLFVDFVQKFALLLGAPALIVSIIVAPIATELPEKFNSIIWIGRKKDVLALGNITGAMVFQSSFPVVFGVCFTHWNLRGATMLSAALALVSSLLILIWVKATKSLNPIVLMAGGLFYAVFLFFILTGRCR